MKINRVFQDNTLTVRLEGWLDTTTSTELGAEMDSVESFGALIFDFDKLEYISSAGLRQVVSGARKAKELNADFSIVNVGPEVMSVFKLTGLDKKYRITAK